VGPLTSVPSSPSPPTHQASRPRLLAAVPVSAAAVLLPLVNEPGTPGLVRLNYSDRTFQRTNSVFFSQKKST
jgi:hypothetical protein